MNSYHYFINKRIDNRWQQMFSDKNSYALGEIN